MYSWKFQYELIRATQNFKINWKFLCKNIVLYGLLYMQNFMDKFP